MSPRRRLLHALCLLWATVFLSAGCATLGIPKPPFAEDITKKRESRKAAVVESFERGRDFAEYQAALNQWKQGDADGCQKQLETLLARTPNHRDARRLLDEIRRSRPETGVVHASLEAPAEADKSRRTVLSPVEGESTVPDNPLDPRNPSNPQRWIGEGVDALESGSDEAALDCFDRAAAIAPHDPQVPLRVAVACLGVNRPDMAVALAKAGLKTFPKSAPLCRVLAAAHYRLGDYTSSQVVLQQALSLDNSSALTYFLMGCTLRKLGQPQAAETHFRRAREIDPSFATGR